MIQEAKQQYRGVLCIHCRQPIPLPTNISRRAAEPEGRESSQAQDHGPRVFTLRCRACGEEGLDTESKFIDCEGIPRTRVSRSRKAQEKLSHAANGGNLQRALPHGNLPFFDGG